MSEGYGYCDCGALSTDEHGLCAECASDARDAYVARLEAECDQLAADLRKCEAERDALRDAAGALVDWCEARRGYAVHVRSALVTDLAAALRAAREATDPAPGRACLEPCDTEEVRYE